METSLLLLFTGLSLLKHCTRLNMLGLLLSCHNMHPPACGSQHSSAPRLRLKRRRLPNAALHQQLLTRGAGITALAAQGEMQPLTFVRGEEVYQPQRMGAAWPPAPQAKPVATQPHDRHPRAKMRASSFPAPGKGGGSIFTWALRRGQERAPGPGLVWSRGPPAVPRTRSGRG